MYLNLTVPMPSEKGKLTTKTIKNTPYVYYEISRTYDSDKKYNSPKRVCIGKKCPDISGMIIPNTNFLRYFPEVALPDEAEGPERSSCLHVGAYFVIRKVIHSVQEGSGIPLDTEHFALQNTITDLSNRVFGLSTGITKVRVYIWVEGQDIDSIETQSQGANIEVSLNFYKDLAGYYQ